MSSSGNLHKALMTKSYRIEENFMTSINQNQDMPNLHMRMVWSFLVVDTWGSRHRGTWGSLHRSRSGE